MICFLLDLSTLNIDENEEKINTSKNKYYLYVGRISKEKGVDLFCEAVTELGYEGIVVGNGDEKEKLESEYPNIEFVGWKTNEEVKAYMKKAKALIFPSKWYETAGLTVLEAQALGLPCIVSNNCAAKEFIRIGKNGYIFEGIEELKSTIQRANQIKNFNSIELEKYNTNNYILNIKKLFLEL